jgi:hypothetical protein
MNNSLTPKQLWQFLYLPETYQNPDSSPPIHPIEIVSSSIDLNWFNSSSRIALAAGWQSFVNLTELLGLVSAKRTIRKELRGTQIRNFRNYFGSAVFDELILGADSVDGLVYERININRRFDIRDSPSGDLSVFGRFGFLMFASIQWPADIRNRLSILVPADWLKVVPKPLRLVEADLNRLVEFVTPSAQSRHAHQL